MKLIANNVAFSIEDARATDFRNLLRFKNRICRICNEEFDIEKKGIFYRCGCE